MTETAAARINGQQTNKLARCKVLSELRSREYVIVSNSCPMTIRSHQGVEFMLGIHGQRRKNAWPTHNPHASYYTFVYIPLNEHEPAKFWIITREQAETAHRAYHKRNRQNQNKTGGGFAWADLENFPDGRWSNLPA
jgi:hypothetical protein